LRQSGGVFEYCGEHLELGQVLDALNHTGEFSSEEMSFLQRCTKLTGLPSLYRRAMYYWWAKLVCIHVAFVFDDNDMPHIRGHLRLRLQSPLGEWQTPWRLLSHHCLNGTPLRFRNRTEAPIFHMLSVLVGDGGDEDEEEVLRFARFHLIPRSGTFPDAHLFPKIPEQNSWLSPRQLSGNCYMPHQVFTCSPSSFTQSGAAPGYGPYDLVFKRVGDIDSALALASGDLALSYALP